MRHEIIRVLMSIVLFMVLSSCNEKADPGMLNNIDLDAFDIVDLTHALDSETIFWPTSPMRLEHKELSYGMTDAGYFYSAYTLSLPEHGGTHLDAPIHFSSTGMTADQIPIRSLLGRCIIIDVSEKAQSDRDYKLAVQDILDFEAAHGRIEPRSIVLLRTGWSAYWPDVKSYLGDDTPGDASRLSFPSFGAEAAAFLIEQRQVKAIGVDTASIDRGQSTDFMVHQVVAAHNIPAFENLTNLDQLPQKGAFLVALPTKVGGGSGAPLRAVAFIPQY